MLAGIVHLHSLEDGDQQGRIDLALSAELPFNPSASSFSVIIVTRNQITDEQQR